MAKNLLVAQSGGPTSAINATLAGVVERAFMSGEIDKIYGGIHGIKGIMKDDIVEIGPKLLSPEKLELLAHTPSSALGTCRLKLKNDPEEFKRIIEVLKKHKIEYFVYIGGNDSMDTVLQLSQYCKEKKVDVKVVGAPKTIDNDLCAMDHTPGFGSAAKYIATSVAEVFCDVQSYDIKTLTIIEVMGRNAGWLTAASALSSLAGGQSPHLIYLPEAPFSEERFVADIKAQFEKTPYVLAVVSEGIKNADGKYICEQDDARSIDAFGHKALSGTASYLAQVGKNALDCKVRPIELSLLQRCAAHVTSATDLAESRMLGAMALNAALEGKSGEMSVITRISDDPYQVHYDTTHTSKVANHEKAVPVEWLNEARNHVNEKMIEYIKPLIQGEGGAIYKNGVPQFFPAFWRA